MRLIGRRVPPPPVSIPSDLEQRLTALEARQAELELIAGLGWSLAPVWLSAALAHARANEWHVRFESEAIVFEHGDLPDEYAVAMPLPTDAQNEIARKLCAHLRYFGPRHLLPVQVKQTRRIMDLPSHEANGF